MAVPLLDLFLNLLFCLRLSGGGFPRPLSAAEERDAVDAMLSGDESARAKLIEHNLRLVAHIVKKYYSASNEQDDLVSIGTIGLIKAVSSFRPDKNIRLATFAARCIENEIFMYFRALRRRGCEVSLQDPIDTDKDGNELELGDILSYETDMSEAVDRRDRADALRKAVADKLDPRERDIITQRYGLGKHPPRTQREVASREGISRSYVSRRH